MANSGKITERGSDGIAFEAATPASQPGDVFPSGVMMAYAGTAAPTNWLFCDGTAVSRSTYAALFAAIGTTFGAGDGSTTFNLPDMRGKMPIGKHSSGTFVTLGATGGEENHTLSAAEMPAHTHTGPSHTHSVSGNTGAESAFHTHTFTFMTGGIPSTPGSTILGGAGGTTTTGSLSNESASHVHAFSATSSAAGTGATGSAGSGGTHNNMPPYRVLNYIIKT